MSEINIYAVKNNIGAMLAGIYGITGTGISGDSIIIYTSSQEAESEVRNIIGYNYQGYNIQVIRTGRIQFL